MKLSVICTHIGMKFDYQPIVIDTLKFYKDRQFSHPVTPENLEYFKSLPGSMFAYPNNPEFGLSKLTNGDTPLYTNGEIEVKSIEVIN